MNTSNTYTTAEKQYEEWCENHRLDQLSPIEQLNNELLTADQRAYIESMMYVLTTTTH